MQYNPASTIDGERMARSAIGVGAKDGIAHDFQAGIYVQATFGEQWAKALLAVEGSAKRAMAVRRSPHLVSSQGDLSAFRSTMHADSGMVSAHGRILVWALLYCQARRGTHPIGRWDLSGAKGEAAGAGELKSIQKLPNDLIISTRVLNSGGLQRYAFAPSL